MPPPEEDLEYGESDPLNRDAAAFDAPPQPEYV